MTLDTLVPSRETCERMARAGWTTPTVFAWTRRDWSKDEWSLVQRQVSLVGEAPAPTAQEIADELPGYSAIDECDCWRVIRWRGMYLAEFFNDDDPLGPCSLRHARPTMVEALAALWLALNEKERT